MTCENQSTIFWSVRVCETESLTTYFQERLQVEEANSKKYQSMADGTSKLLDQIIGLVTKLFNTLECDDQKIAEAQGLTQ